MDLMTQQYRQKNDGKNIGMNRAATRFGSKIKPKNLKETVLRLLKTFGNQKLLLCIVIISVFISTGASLFVPLTIGNLIDFISYKLLDKINLYILILLALYILSAFFNWFSEFLVAKISQNIVSKLRRQLFYQLEKLPLKYFEENPHGDIMSRFTNDLEAVSSVVSQSTITLFSSIITVIGSIVIMINLNFILTIVVMFSVPCIALLSKTIAKKTVFLFKGQQKSIGAINSMVEESVNGLDIIQSYNQEEHILQQFKKANEDAFIYGKSAQIWSGLLMPLMNVINNFTFAIIAFLGGYLAIQGIITVGIIASFIAYSRQFIRPLNELAFTYNNLMAAIAGAERVFEILDEAIEKRNTDGLVKPLKGAVSFEKVSFGYDSKQKVLKDISFNISKGQKIAIVGPTGAGKTTLINVLTKFYSHNEGNIIVDDVDIKDYEYSSYLKQFGIVLQDSYLFSGTILENIRYGQPKATKEEVYEASKFAMVHEIIMKLPKQYDTKLTYGGLNLSHGERQLITIARAVLANPSILILDEATSSVDLKTEKQITQAMRKVMEERTSFVIAHRLSTIKDADLILVLQDGQITEQGNHENLMKKNGFYAKMILSQ
jgi:ATP-binding cassette subfamily B protein